MTHSILNTSGLGLALSRRHFVDFVQTHNIHIQSKIFWRLHRHPGPGEAIKTSDFDKFL